MVFLGGGLKYTIYKNMPKKKKSILVLSTGCVYDVNATKLSLYYYSVICHLCPRCNVTAAAGWHVVSLVSCRRTPNAGKLPCALSSLYVKRAAGWTLSLSIDTPMIHQWVTSGLSHTTELVVVYSTEFFKMHFLPIHTNSKGEPVPFLQVSMPIL